MLRHDQAEGLRRLLAPAVPRVIALCGAAEGMGCGTALLNLAVALAHRGRDVMVLDRRSQLCVISAALGMPARAAGRRTAEAEDPIQRGPAGIAIVAGTPGLGASAEAAPDTPLLPVARGAEADALAPVDAGADVVAVTTAVGAEITAAYALVKRLATEAGARHVHLLVDRAQSQTQAAALTRNMARVARQFLAVSLDLLGWVPADPTLDRAARLRLPVVEAFPEAPAARAYRAMADAIAAWPLPGRERAEATRLVQSLLRHERLPGAALGAA